ncbi:MAG: pyruvate synthase [Chloroflexota bacterium]
MKMTLGAVASPGTSRANKTGSWRTTRRPMFLHISCIACELCALSCPEDCITGDVRNTYCPDFNYCKGCGVCATVCPVHDIEMIPEEQGTPCIPGVSPRQAPHDHDNTEIKHLSTA